MRRWLRKFSLRAPPFGKLPPAWFFAQVIELAPFDFSPPLFLFDADPPLPARLTDEADLSGILLLGRKSLLVSRNIPIFLSSSLPPSFVSMKCHRSPCAVFARDRLPPNDATELSPLTSRSPLALVSWFVSFLGTSML